jgi:hypothetical protein
VNEKEEVLRDLELLRCEVKDKTEPINWGPPQLITIEHDDYHAKYIGRTNEGLQFFVTALFVPAMFGNPGNEFDAVFLFSNDGDLVESWVDELRPRASMDLEHARMLRAQRLAELGDVTFQDIRVKPFAVEYYGEMGLIPSKFESKWSVELLPGNCMAFHEPWDSGGYDT